MSFPRSLTHKSDSFLNSRSTPSLKSRSHTPQQTLPSESLKTEFDGQKVVQYAGVGPSFQIYHDPPSNKAPALNAFTGPPEIHDDKENILRPKVMGLAQLKYPYRAPLKNLSIHKYPGYLSSVDLLRRGRHRLVALYQPKNSQNASGSLHRFNSLPSFVTPPRNTLKKILHRSGTNQLADDDDTDDLETMLLAKLREVARRKRAMSVGANRGKIHLVRQNACKISTV